MATKRASPRNRKRETGAGEGGRGVVYVGHIPHGFYEPQMKKFFGQFGQVTRLRISRSKKSGKSKGYAFVEFRQHPVAKVAADTMNGYLFFNSILKCELLPQEKIHPELFKGSEKRFSHPKAAKVAGDRNDSEKTPAQEKRRLMKLKKKNAARAAKLAALGIDADSVQLSDSPVPDTVKTPRGKLAVLKEDAQDTEITFKTPPGGIKSSRLSMTPARPKTRAKKTVKRLAK